MPRATRKTTITSKGIDEARKADMPTEDFLRDRTINIIDVKQMIDPPNTTVFQPNIYY